MNIWLSPLILIGATIYLFYRIHKDILQKRLLERIKKEWLPDGKHVFFLYPDSKKWKDFLKRTFAKNSKQISGLELVNEAQSGLEQRLNRS